MLEPKVELYQRQITVVGGDAPYIIGICRVMNELRLNGKLDAAEHFIGALWHSWRVVTMEPDMAEGGVPSPDGLATFFDFYFDTRGDFRTIEKRIQRSIVDSLTPTGIKQFNDACDEATEQYRCAAKLVTAHIGETHDFRHEPGRDFRHEPGSDSSVGNGEESCEAEGHHAAGAVRSSRDGGRDRSYDDTPRDEEVDG